MPSRLLPVLTFCLCSIACAQTPVIYHHQLRHNPNLSIHILIVDLANPDVSLRISRAGDDPDGPGPWSTTLMSVPQIAQRDNYDIAINGDFFAALNTKDVEGAKTGYVSKKWASPTGYAVTDDKLWHKAATTRSALLLDSPTHAKLELIDPKKVFPPYIHQALGGGVFLLKDGDTVPQTNPARHPRTAIGLDKSGSKLFILVVDGRQPNLSIGMTYSELAAEFQKLGAHTAINLDGGGSTTLVLRDPSTHKLHILNHPSDGKPRPIADALGISIRGGLPSTRATSN